MVECPTGGTTARASVVEQPGNPPPTIGCRSNSIQSSSSASIAAARGSSNATAATASRRQRAEYATTIGRHNRPIGGPARANEHFEPQAKRAASGHPLGIRPAATAKERPVDPRAAMVAVASSCHQPRRQAKDAGSNSSYPASLSSTLSHGLCEAYAEIDRLEAARGDQFNGRVLRPPSAPCATEVRRARG